MRTLAVAGCSYSDYTMVEKTYGDYLAEELGYKYLHCARGGGSNHRSIFVLSRAILAGDIKENDIIIFQFTDPHRKLLPSIEPYVEVFDAEPGTPGRVEQHDTEYGPAYTSDYKMGSWVWQAEPENKKLHQALEQWAHCVEYEMELLAVQFRLFEMLCKEHKILLVPLINRYVTNIPLNRRGSGDVLADIRQTFTPISHNRTFNERDFIRFGSPENPCKYDIGWYDLDGEQSYDSSHLSDLGHQKIAEKLGGHMIRHKLIVE